MREWERERERERESRERDDRETNTKKDFFLLYCEVLYSVVQYTTVK